MGTLHTVYVGIGSNLGDRIANIILALSALIRVSSELTLSPLYLSTALMPDGAPSSWNLEFINCAVRFLTDLAPKELLRKLKQIEEDVGRVQGERWSPRVIDLDLLIYDDYTFSDSELTIPHRELLNRPFAILPTLDIATGEIRERFFGISHATQANSESLRNSEPGAAWHASKSVHLQMAAALNNDSVQSSAFKAVINRPPDLVAIINITPDSFSDTERIINPRMAIDAVRTAIAGGASIIDIGAESTRPGATPLDWQEEWSRIEPILSEVVSISHSEGIAVSIDTRHIEVVDRVLERGVDWINDVSAGRDVMILRAVAAAGAKYLCMHSLTVPADRSVVMSRETNPIEAVFNWGRGVLDSFQDAGGSPGRLILDPGLGFGKSSYASWRMVRDLGQLISLGTSILIGHSRKSFLSPDGVIAPGERDVETAMLTFHLGMIDGVDYLRVHNLAINQRALNLAKIARNGVLL